MAKKRKAKKKTKRSSDRIKAAPLTAEDEREAEAGEAGSRPPTKTK